MSVTASQASAQNAQLDVDVLVIGSGGAGAAAAAAAAEEGARVLVVSKDPLVCSDSKISEGIVSVRGADGRHDSSDNLATNMRLEGSDIGDPQLLRAFAQDSGDAYAWLQRWGLKPFRAEGRDAPVSFALGGHNRPRSIPHPQAGLDYAHSLWSALLQHPQGINYMEDAWCLDVLSGPDGDGASRVCGALIYDAPRGRILAIRAPAVILACGGLSTLYFPHTDTMRGNTGDGYAIAARQGCDMIDMEQIQFIPFGLVGPKSYEGLVVGEPASAGPLGVLRDAQGQLLMTGIMRRNRAEVSAAIALAVANGGGTEAGGCYLDLRRNAQGESGAVYLQLFGHLGHAFIKIIRNTQGPKAARLEEPWEVRPTAHYCMGGVRAQADGATAGKRAVAGLFVAGQVLGGLHGGNRLGSTSLAEAAIFGRRAGASAARYAQVTGNEHPQFGPICKAHQAIYAQWLHQDGTESAANLTQQLQKLAWQCLGPVRDAAGLRRGLAGIAAIRERLSAVKIAGPQGWNQHFIDFIELHNQLTCAELIAHAALDREHSLGAHVRIDAGPAKASQLSKPYSVILRAEQPASTTSASNTSQQWECERLPRARTPAWHRVQHRLAKQLSIRVLDLLYKLPHRRVDRLLLHIYQQRARRMGVALDSTTASQQRQALRLQARWPETNTSETFRFVANQGPLPRYRAGQFANFHLHVNGKEYTRSYSLSSAPTQSEALDITIQREPGGVVSNWLIDHLQPEDQVLMSRPMGDFCLPANGAHRVPSKLLLLGAGSGVTPLMSMLRWLHATDTPCDIVMVLSARQWSSLIFAEELAELSRSWPSLRLCLALTGDTGPNAPATMTSARGRLTASTLEHWVPDLATRQTYLCGPAAFMADARQFCIELGLPRRRLHQESFQAGLDLGQGLGDQRFRVRFASAQATVHSQPGQSLLDLAEDSGIDMSFSCRTGTCGECKVRLCDGEVRMACTAGLTAAEQEQGFILSCSAVPLTDCELEA